MIGGIVVITALLEEESAENSQNMSKASSRSISDSVTQPIMIDSTLVVD